MSGEKVVHTYCAQCSSLCPVCCYVKDGKFVRVAPDHSHPGGGSLCPKGWAAPELVYNSQRLKYPLRRTRPKGAADPGWERISWDTALDLVADRVAKISATYGAEAVAFYRPAKSGSPATDYEDFMRRLANCLGSPNTLSTGYICQWHRDSGSRYTYGAGIPDPDLKKCGSFLLWGYNPANTSNSFYQNLRRAKTRGAKLIVVDPRRTQTAEMADLWLGVRPGSDGILALTLLRVLVEEGLADEAFVRDWTNAPFLMRKDTGELLTAARLENLRRSGEDEARDSNLLEPEDLLAWDGKTLIAYRSSRRSFVARLTPSGAVPLDAAAHPSLLGSYPLTLAGGETVVCHPVWQGLQGILADFDPAATRELTGVSEEQVRACIRLIGGNKPLSYYSYNGIEPHAHAMQTNRALGLFYTVTGDLGKEGGNRWWPKVPTNDLTGRKLLPWAQETKRLGWREKPLGPPATNRVAAHDFYAAVLEEKPYPVKAFLSFGGNVLMSNPNSPRGANALAALDFYLQTDFFLNPSATFADVVLPAATSWEGCYVRAGFGVGSPDARGRVQLRERVVEPLYESRPDPEIILDLGVRLGFGDKLWGGDLEQALNYYLAPSGFTVAELRRHPTGVDYSLGPVTAIHTRKDAKTGLPAGFGTPSGRIEVYSSSLAGHGYPAFPDAAGLKPDCLPESAAEFPLILTNFKLREFCHGQHRAVPFLRRKVPYPYVEINPDTASVLNLQDGRWARLETPYGHIRLQVKITEVVPPGVAATQHGWWQECPELGLPGFDALNSSGANINLIIDDSRRDPLSGSIPIKSYRCRIISL